MELQKGDGEGGLSFEENVLRLGKRTEVQTQEEEGEVFVGMGANQQQNDTSGAGSLKKVPADEHLAIDIPDTAHQISQDSWFQVGFVLTTGVNSAYVLGYSGTLMLPLGWVGGVLGLILATAISLYANCLVAKLHEFGGKRHIRYRDLAGAIYDRKAYALTWGLQYVNLFMINVGFIILAGQALKAVYVLFTDEHTMKLPHFIALAGIEAPPRDYSIPGTKVSKIFTTIGAVANLVFAFNTGMLPEIQATIRQPVVENMLKALYFQFTVGVLPMYAVTFIGYWAYGSNTSTFLLNSVSGPVWLKAIANLAAFLQTVISLHIFASPTYEYLDTKFDIRGSALAFRNLWFRITVRGGYLGITTFIAAMLPFLGDFMSLTGAFSTFPLTFILANHMYLIAKRTKLNSLQKSWHWFNVCFFGFLAVAAGISALRLIAVDSSTYHTFADL